MTYYVEHGGECCGMSHIYDMGETKETLRVVDRTLRDLPTNHLVEIVLTDRQIKRNKSIPKGLKKRGFKLVSRFYNDNSGNYCNVLHRYPLTGKGSGKKNSPWHEV